MEDDNYDIVKKSQGKIIFNKQKTHPKYSCGSKWRKHSLGKINFRMRKWTLHTQTSTTSEKDKH